jgi:WD40 repeat protein
MAWPSPPLDVKPVAGFHGTKVESIAVAANGTRLFAGSSDGSLVIYDCRRDTPDAVRSGSVELKQITQLAAGSADGSRRPSITGALGGSSKSTAVSGLTVVDAWRMLLGLVDGQLVAYDVNTCRKIAELPETKGALLLSVHPTSQRVVVVTKKKQLLTYAYQGGPTGVGIGGGYAPPLARVPNDAPDAEFSCVLPDVPLCVCLCGSSASQGTVNSVLHLSLMVVLGYKKHYELKDLASGQTTRLLDTDRPGIALLLPASPVREQRVLISSGSKGVFVNPLTRSVVTEERLTWSAPPVHVSPLLHFNDGEVCCLSSLLVFISIYALLTNPPPLCPCYSFSCGMRGEIKRLLWPLHSL